MLERLHWFAIRVVKFFEDTMKAVEEYQHQRALKYTRNYRLEKYLESKGCLEVQCVEHWIREFEKEEAKNIF